MLYRPIEIDALEEAEEQRRPKGRERAADIADEEDEEDKGLHLVLAVPVGLDQRADQQHGGAGGAEQARDERAEGEHRRVGRGRADEIAADANAAGNDEQREQQDYEGKVVEQQHVHGFGDRRHCTKNDGTRKKEDQRPKARDLAEMMLPEMRRDERKKRDGEEEPGKGDRPKETECRPVEMGRGADRRT